ncbi:unnamed protein product, partial [Rotaria sp. Silwood2]
MDSAKDSVDANHHLQT